MLLGSTEKNANRHTGSNALVIGEIFLAQKNDSAVHWHLKTSCDTPTTSTRTAKYLHLNDKLLVFYHTNDSAVFEPHAKLNGDSPLV